MRVIGPARWPTHKGSGIATRAAIETIPALARAEIERRRDLDAKRAAAESDLLAFVRLLWPVVEPATEFIDGWVLHAMIDTLHAIADGEIKRCIINVPPGSMKPNHVSALLMTRRGRVRLGEIVAGDEVITHRGRYRRVLAVHEQGVLPLLKVTTRSGRMNLTAPDHPYLTTRGWVQARHLTDMDVLAAVCPEDTVDNQITKEGARFLGYMVGDGAATHHPTFTNADPEVLADFAKCAAALGIGTCQRAIGPSKPNGYKATIFGLTGALALLEQHRLRGKSSYEKRIPEAVLGSSNEIIAHFLAAYWSCDGQIVVRHTHERGSIYMANATTVNRDLAVDLQHALLRLGIDARVRAKVRALETARQPGGKYRYYHVGTNSHEDTVLFKKLPGLCRTKAAQLDLLVARRFVQGPLIEDPIIAILPGGEGECRCLTVEEDSSFTANDLAVHNSLLLNVFYPAWLWGPCNRPHLRFLSASYSVALPERDNDRFRRVVSSDIYQRFWGGRVQLVKEGLTLIENRATGWKRAISSGGGTTGHRADYFLCDDINNPSDVESQAIREQTSMWLREVVPDRLTSLERGVIVNLQQRTHEQDATGVLAEVWDDFAWVMIPMDYDPERDAPVVLRWGEDGEPAEVWRDPRGCDADGVPLSDDERWQRAGELAWPERFPAAEVEKLKKIKGPYAWASQYSQSPTVRGGEIIKRDWWQPWTKPEYPALGTVIASLDTAQEQHSAADYNAITVWGAFAGPSGEPKLILVAAWRERLPLAQLVARVAETCAKHKADYLLIEHKTRGRDVCDEIRRLYATAAWRTILIDPKGDKVSRLNAVSHLFSGDVRRDPVTGLDVWSGGLIHAPDRDWADAVISEVASFPRGAHDDFVDSVSQAISWIRVNGVALRRVEYEADEYDRKLFRKTPGVPYAL